MNPDIEFEWWTEKEIQLLSYAVLRTRNNKTAAVDRTSIMQS